MDCPLNIHGDQFVLASTGHGADIAIQRADGLGQLAIEQAANRHLLSCS